MELNGLHADRDAALAALAWLVEAGCDTLVEAQPCAWLSPPAPAVAPAAALEPTQRAVVIAAPATNRATDAAALAASADSLPALKAALTEWLGQPPLFADGIADAGVMLIGDMPTPDDIAAGQLFAGAPGRLLDRMLAAIDRSRADTYLTTLHYQPLPGGSDPAQLATSLPFIRRHIELVRPRAVLALGGVAAAGLLGATSGIGRLRGRWTPLVLGDLTVPVLASFTPAYLLTHPAHKALAWSDLQAFQDGLRP